MLMRMKIKEIIDSGKIGKVITSSIVCFLPQALNLAHFELCRLVESSARAAFMLLKLEKQPYTLTIPRTVALFLNLKLCIF